MAYMFTRLNFFNLLYSDWINETELTNGVRGNKVCLLFTLFYECAYLLVML